MQFRVPKYLEREATIAFGMTFKHLAVAGGIGVLLFFLYYILPKIAFIFIAILFAGAFFIFNFVKVQGESLFEVFSHFSSFLFSSRFYFWEKKQGIQHIRVIKEKKKKSTVDDKAALKIAPRSQLHDLRSKIDVGEL